MVIGGGSAAGERLSPSKSETLFGIERTVLLDLFHNAT
jgi:hypothetical protein